MGGRATRIMQAILIAAAVAWVAVGAVLFLGQRSLIFPREPGRLGPEAAGLPDMRVERVASGDGTPVEVWRGGPAAAPLVLLFHGNGETVARSGARIAIARRAGFQVAAMEYRGYNGAPGEPSESALRADSEAVVAALGREGIGPERIVVWGYSIGSGLAVPLAARHRFAGLVLEAPFLSLAEVAAGRYPLLPARWLVRDPFRSDEAAPAVAAPTLVLAGGRDGLVPPDQSERLAGLIPGARLHLAPQAGHGSILADPAAAVALADFLRAAAAR